MFLNIYKTSSRGPWLDVMLGCLLLVIFGRGKIRKNILIIGVSSVGCHSYSARNMGHRERNLR